MQERDFLLILQERAREQKKAMEAVPFPKVFRFVIEWLSVHPWRFLIPLAFLISLLFRGVIGTHYTDAVLLIFRSL